MSEPETEPFEPNEPFEPEPDELAPDEQEAAEAEGAEPEAAEETELEPEPQGMSEKELEAARKKLDNENARHAGRVSEIIGDEATALIPCPLCADFAAGFVFDTQPPEDVAARVMPFLGLPDPNVFKTATDKQRCEGCDGRGAVLTASFVPGNQSAACSRCNGSGYVMVAESGATTPPVAAPNGPVEVPLMEGVNPDDPAVAELRARGFTVIPPMQVTVEA